MTKKVLRCYELNVKKNNIVCKKENFKNLVNIIFDPSQNKQAITLVNGNGFIKYSSEKGDSFSLELLKPVKSIPTDDDYMFFRIGKQKDMQDVLKRNKATLLGEGVLDDKQQKIYELEVCTYILVDLRKGIILEMYGQYAPTIKILTLIINADLEKIDDFNNLRTHILFKNIMTEKMIETFKTTGNKLGKIGYTYSIPSANNLEKLGLGIKQIQALNLMGELELEFIIRNKPRIPLTRSNEIIKSVVDSFKECTQNIKETLFFEGSTKANSSQKFTFSEEEVTYNLDISYYRNEDNLKIPLSLEEIEQQVYEKIKSKYESNRDDILSYI